MRRTDRIDYDALMPDPTTVLDHRIVSSRYFYPRREAFSSPYWLKGGDGSRLACYYQEVRAEATTVVYFHGNGEVVADYLPEFPEWFTGAGYNILLAEYRGYGMSDGTPALAGMLDDVESLIESLKIPDRRIVLFGRSIGSLYALHGVYRRPQVGGLIIESGAADLTDPSIQRVTPGELGVSQSAFVAELKRYFDFKEKLRAFQGQTLILHARHDELLPVRHAQLLFEAAPEPKELQVFERGGHNDISSVNQPDYMRLVENFLARI
jgi:pimeloyl-ACP methyl ester carboxylesterase